jgi:Icc-related predicted phosphoesterase
VLHSEKKLIIDCISDLHGYYPWLEGGDLLIIAGDLTASDKPEQYFEFEEWLQQQNYKKKVVIAGNHDNFLVENGPYMFEGADYLCDSGTEFEDLCIWGSPWTQTFKGMNPHCKAFTVETKDDEDFLKEKWAKIPYEVDILVTHSPPYGILDLVKYQPYNNAVHCGNRLLYGLLKYAFRPQLHVFGHIHEGYGQVEEFCGYNNTMVKSINASHVNVNYRPCNSPIRIELKDAKPNKLFL